MEFGDVMYILFSLCIQISKCQQPTPNPVIQGGQSSPAVMFSYVKAKSAPIPEFIAYEKEVSLLYTSLNALTFK